MGYFDIFKDKTSQKKYKGVGKKAVKTQMRKRKQLREASGGGSPRKYPKPKRRKPRRSFWQKLTKAGK